MVVDSGVFPQSALDANKNGQLTDSQRAFLRTLSRGVRRQELNVALLAAALGLVVFIGVRSSSPVLVRIGIPIACLALAAFLLFRALGGDDKLTRDLRHPQVQSLEGPISRQVMSSDSGGPGGGRTDHYLTVAGRRFKVGPGAYKAAPDAGFVRIYFLPLSGHVVNLERLPDRLLPEGSTGQTILHEFMQAMRSHERTQIDTVRAEMAGTGNALRAAISPDVVPPTGAGNGRPLADDILGIWSGGPIRAVFTDNGVVRITILGANERSGHWSIGDDGKLITDLAGRNAPTTAWIAGDKLTVSLGDSAITLTRAPN